jgi:hypothetical protein
MTYKLLNHAEYAKLLLSTRLRHLYSLEAPLLERYLGKMPIF